MASIRAAFTKVAAPPVFETVEQRWSMFPYLVVVLVLLTLVSLFHVWSRVRVMELNYQITDADRAIREAKQEAGRLRLEVASLKTPARIESLAREELGMTLPADQQVIPVK